MTAVLPDRKLRQGSRTDPLEQPGSREGSELPAFPTGAPSCRQVYATLCEVGDISIAMATLVGALLLTNLDSMPKGLAGFFAVRITLQKLLLVGLFLVVWRSSFRFAGLYDVYRVTSRARELASAVRASTIGSTFTLVFAWHSESGAFGMRTALYFWLAATALVLLWRILLRTLAFDPANAGTRDVIIIGTGPRASRLYRVLSDGGRSAYNVLGFVDSSEAVSAKGMNGRLLGTLDQLESILMRRPLDEVLIALPIRSCYGAIEDAIQVCERVGVRARYLADAFPASLARPRFDESREFPAVAMAIAPEDARLIVKRLIDIVGSIVGLILLGPLMLLTAVAIKLTSRGPAVFTQARLGLNKRRFSMFKFRTMIADAEACQAALESRNEADGPVFKIRDDPRITPIGKFLRKSSIDELPQFLNVLRGEMSLVGPRPLPLRDVGRFTEPRAMRRFSMRPGLTCLWQTRGRSALGFEDWIRLDLEYIDHWSLSLDLRILAKTVPVVFRGTGAS